jgi:3-oxoacyl-[acyl-carrier protein] reductase
MSGRRVVVTGGTAGIGLAITRRLLSEGHGVFICGRNSGRLESAIAKLSAEFKSARVDGATCDVRELASVQSMIAAAQRHLGGIDCLVNNAGTAFIKEFGEILPEMWSEIVDTNLTGVFNCCHAVLPWLKKAGSGGQPVDIVNIGSRSGRYSFRGGVGYNTTKFGLQGLTEAMFLDLNQYGIRVGLVAPGSVGTGFAGVAPVEWHLRPEDVGDAVFAMISAKPGACVNWVEIRPARPPA